MLGHSFLHGGPWLAGVSRAIVHVLLGGSPETATVQLEDCPDYDIRKIIQSLDGEAELSEEEHQDVLDLSLSWDLPGPTKENPKWLFERLLFHAESEAAETDEERSQRNPGLAFVNRKERKGVFP
ncbi:hypothetical protein DPEC_G00157980 [Dallia pectoralis]|uniref:Uncharacterized protein n=1 Tax=Dallia pectoralis TaxID=75939 RepID=A0ACC2GLJ0_DALPE|nr:hypothetical protein DPEC_G00157980 [Dallia pectoralis]